MSGNWIKMRVDLYRDPKVCAIADILLNADSELARYVSQNKQSDMCVTRNVMRNVTVGALLSVWGVMRTRGKRVDDDLVCRCARHAVIDDIAEVPGFGEAMLSVGWVEETDEGIVFPRFFEEHNVDPAETAKKKNAERQRRFREKSKDQSSVTDNVTVTHREEKRREDISTTDVVDKTRTKRVDAAKPIEVQQSVWDDFMALRKAKKSPLSPTALHGIEREAAKAGLSLEAALSMCCSRGWQSFKADWVKEDGNAGQKQTTRNGAAMASYGTIFPTTQEGQDNGRTIDAAPRLG